MDIKKATFDNAIDFSSLNMDFYKSAFNDALKAGRARFQELRTRDAAQDPLKFLRDFSDIGADIEEVSEVFFALLNTDGTPEMHAYSQEVVPEMTRFTNEIFLDTEIFKRVESSVEALKKQNVKGEWLRYVEHVHRDFVRNGVHLPADKKKELEKIDEEVGVLELKFRENLMKEIAAFQLVVENAEDLKGLPDRDLEAAKQKAEAKGLKGWLFTLDAPTYTPFVTYVEKRALREKMVRASAKRCMSGEYDNRANLVRMATLRQKRAELLGFRTHAEYMLKDRMAKTPEAVKAFLKRVVEVSLPKAQRELEELKAFAKSQGFAEELRPWDTAFYSEKLKKQKLQFDEEELRPYFAVEKVVAGLFTHAKKLYGLNFTERNDLPKFNPENRVFEVKDDEGNYLGLYYLDLFPRDTKSPGAWETTFRKQGLCKGKVHRPHVINVCNFTKPTATKPSLLSFREVETLFHEFGHASHDLLSKCEVRALGGTNVLWDFVELPSQIMENWVNHPEGLALVAAHYESGTAMPPELIEKIRKSKTFMAGWSSLAYTSMAMLDLGWHHDGPLGLAPSPKLTEQTDVETFEIATTAPYRLMERIPGASVSAVFAHIFAGGYSAGYYSYKWAEVLDADAFEFFTEKGVYNSEVAKKFRSEILSRGNSEDPEVLYERFRGRKPDPDALFRRQGLL